MADVKTMALALRYHALQNLIQADDKLFPAELTALSRLDGPLRNAGLMKYDGTLLPAYRRTLDEALTRLPSELSTEGKLEILAETLAGATVDGETADAERAVLSAVAAALDIPIDAYTAWEDENFSG